MNQAPEAQAFLCSQISRPGDCWRLRPGASRPPFRHPGPPFVTPAPLSSSRPPFRHPGPPFVIPAKAGIQRPWQKRSPRSPAVTPRHGRVLSVSVSVFSKSQSKKHYHEERKEHEEKIPAMNRAPEAQAFLRSQISRPGDCWRLRPGACLPPFRHPGPPFVIPAKAGIQRPWQNQSPCSAAGPPRISGAPSVSQSQSKRSKSMNTKSASAQRAGRVDVEIPPPP